MEIFFFKQNQNGNLTALLNLNSIRCIAPFEIIIHLIFLTSNSITRVGQKIYTNIVKFKPLFNNFYYKASHNKRNDIFAQILNKISCQI